MNGVRDRELPSSIAAGLSIEKCSPTLTAYKYNFFDN